MSPEYEEKVIRPERAATDPWENRRAGMQCQTCIWFTPKFGTEPVRPANHKIVGRCRRHAPSMGGYPVVYMNDWCGDHRIDENKV